MCNLLHFSAGGANALQMSRSIVNAVTHTDLQDEQPIKAYRPHPYDSVVDGTFMPRHVAPQTWRLAMPVAVKLLSDDRKRFPEREHGNCMGRRSALCQYLAWLAEHEPELLASNPLDEDEIRRYLATDGMVRRTSHRSRAALKSILRSFDSAATKPRSLEAKTTIAPVSEALFEAALAETAHFRSPITRANTRAMLLLARGAGLDGADLRFVMGDDITQHGGAGTWVTVRNPASPRQVPVLLRFAQQLEDLGAGRIGRPMLAANSQCPVDSSTPTALAAMVTRAINRSGRVGLVQVQGLRKAWVAEQLAANTPLLTLMQAAGVKSLRAFEDLVTQHAPLVPTDLPKLAWELGGLS